jgi:hypothetical protein
MMSEALIPPGPSSEQLDEALGHLTSWLRYLFFTLSSTKPLLVPACPPPPPGVQVIVPCSEQCACFERMQRCPAVHLADVEKVKVIDGLLVSGFGATAEEEMSAFARELLGRYSIDFCARAVSQVQNGQFAITRFHLFEALRLSRRSQAIATVAGIVEDWRSLALIELALQHTLATCQGVPDLAPIVETLIPSSQVCLTRVRSARSSLLMQRYHQQQDGAANGSADPAASFTSAPASAELFALQKHIADMFKLLCNQQFLLCIHYVPYKKSPTTAPLATAATERSASQKQEPSAAEDGSTRFAAPPPPSAASQPPPPKPLPGPPKCANPTCGTVKGELLKCSACKVTWYCSRACQQADWKTHKAFCKATAAERSAQQAAGGSGNAGAASSPTAAAAQWLAERCEKATTGSRIFEFRPMF